MALVQSDYHDLTFVLALCYNRKIYVRCKDARFKVTRASFVKTAKGLTVKPVFEIEYNDRAIYIEQVIQQK